jgi:hypothetical protein
MQPSDFVIRIASRLNFELNQNHTREDECEVLSITDFKIQFIFGGNQMPFRSSFLPPCSGINRGSRAGWMACFKESINGTLTISRCHFLHAEKKAHPLRTRFALLREIKN